MTWSGSNFTRALGSSQFQNDAAANIGIQAGIQDTAQNDLATGIDNCINKNGANTPTANLSMGGFAHTNVADATLRTQYGKVSQIQNNAFNFATTGGAANVQTLTLAPALTAYTQGSVVHFVAGFTNTSTTPTLDVNGLGALTILAPNAGALSPGDITAGRYYNASIIGGSTCVLNNPTPVWNTWVPTLTGFSVNPPNAAYRYYKSGNIVTVSVTQASAGTSNANTFYISAPFTAATVTNAKWTAACSNAMNDSGYIATAWAEIPSAGTTIFLRVTSDPTGTWNTINNKLASFTLTYECV